MSDDEFSLSHRQLISGLISLIIGGDSETVPILGNLGYVLNALEIPMVDPSGSRFLPDLHVLHQLLNLSLLIECKSGPDSIRSRQTSCYLHMQGIEVVRQGRLTVNNPQRHRVDAAFFVLEAAEPEMRIAINAALSSVSTQTAGLGLIRVDRDKTSILIDDLSDPRLSESLAAGWMIRFDRLPLERLPFEPSSPNWELAQSVLQTLNSYFVGGRSTFDVDDLCQDSNELWSYLVDHHDLIRDRVRRMIVQLRGTAYKGWIVKAPGRTAREDRWRFADRSRTNTSAQTSFARWASKFISLLREQSVPTPGDFDNIDQLPLPISFLIDDNT